MAGHSPALREKDNLADRFTKWNDRVRTHMGPRSELSKRLSGRGEGFRAASDGWWVGDWGGEGEEEWGGMQGGGNEQSGVGAKVAPVELLEPCATS